MLNGFSYHKIIVNDVGKPIDYVFLAVNDSFEDMTGIKRDEVIGKRVTEVLQGIKGDSANWIDIYGKVAQSGEPTSFENYSKPLKKWFSVTAYSPKKDFFVAIFEDITDQKNSQEEIKNLSMFPSENPDPVLRISKNGKVQYCNSSAQQVLESQKSKIGEMIPERWRKNLEKAIASGKKIQFEDQIDERTFVFSLSPLKDYVNIYGHDRTENKKAEKALKEAQNDLKHAQVVGKIGSWRLDTKRNVLLWSDENHRIFGIPQGTQMTYQTFLSTIHPDDRVYVDQKWEAGLQGEPYDIEHRIVVDGKVKWVREKAELEFDEDGTLRGGFGTTQDITDMVNMREKLRYYSKHLEDLVEEKTKQLKDAEVLAAIGATAGMVGHDIRNPLQGIDGAVYLAKQEVESLPLESSEREALLEILNLIEEQTHYVDHIVADLQDFAKKPMPQLQGANVQDLIIESLSDMKIPENINVQTIFQDDLGTFDVDPVLLKRVSMNLISNAIQAMPDGGFLTIRISRAENVMCISIKDTGIGIAKEYRTKIFTPLFTTKSKGQGFGLAVCKKLVEAHGGEISFESEEGKGTTFSIKLPLNR